MFSPVCFEQLNLYFMKTAILGSLYLKYQVKDKKDVVCPQID